MDDVAEYVLIDGTKQHEMDVSKCAIRLEALEGGQTRVSWETKFEMEGMWKWFVLIMPQVMEQQFDANLAGIKRVAEGAAEGGDASAEADSAG